MTFKVEGDPQSRYGLRIQGNDTNVVFIDLDDVSNLISQLFVAAVCVRNGQKYPPDTQAPKLN